MRASASIFRAEVAILVFRVSALFALITALTIPLILVASQARADENRAAAPSVDPAVISDAVIGSTDNDQAQTARQPVSAASVRVIQKPPYVPLQLVTIEVALETRALVVGAMDIKYPNLDGATWIEASRAIINGARQERGERFTVLSAMIGLFLRESGMVEIPALDLTVPVLEEGVRRELSARTAPLSIDVTLPAVLTDITYVPASSIRMTSKLVNSPAEFALGQIVEQQVLIEAEGVLSVTFPDWTVPISEGLKSQILPPRADLSASRGILTSTLDFRARHVVVQAGAYSIASYGVNWWDTENHLLKRIEPDPIEFHVLDSRSDSESAIGIFELIALVFGFLLLIFGLWHLALQCKRIWQKLSQPVLDERLNP